MKHFLGRIKETNCGYENICDQLITARSYDNALKRLTASAKKFRGHSKENEEGVYDFGDGLVAEVYDLKEIPKEHYEILRIYI